jgi:hypothetical protein
MFDFCVLSASSALLAVALLPLIAHAFIFNITDHVRIGRRRQHAHHAHACRCVEDYQAGTLETLIFHTWKHHSKLQLPLRRKHPSTIRIKVADLTQVHGADGLKVLSAKAASISRCRFLPRCRDFCDQSTSGVGLIFGAIARCGTAHLPRSGALLRRLFIHPSSVQPHCDVLLSFIT